jgi:hypothetical protein
VICLKFCFNITEKARIEAQVKAAEAAAQLKLDEEMRMKREQEREAARLALHMVLRCLSFCDISFVWWMLHTMAIQLPTHWCR